MIPLLKDYCCSFGFDFNDCLLLYLQVVLKMWNPTITFSTTINKGKLHQLINKSIINEKINVVKS